MYLAVLTLYILVLNNISENHIGENLFVPWPSLEYYFRDFVWAEDGLKKFKNIKGIEILCS